MNEEICFADAAGLAASIRSKELSPVEVTASFLDRIQAVDPGVHALVTLADGALEQAREAEQAAVRGELRGPLHGVPFTAKDCFDTAGVRTTRGSLIFAGLVPDTDAAAVGRLKAAGRHPSRQDQPAGVRAQGRDRQPPVRAHSPPRRPGANLRGLERR